MDRKICATFEMFAVLCGCLQDFCFGFYDSIHGLSFLWELDKEPEFVAVNSIPQPSPKPKTVLQQRRELRGTVNRPAEQIIRQRPRVWKRVLQCIVLNVVLGLISQILILIFWFLISFVTSSADPLANLTGPLVVLPVFILTRIIMALWFSDIAGACLRALNLPDDIPPCDVRMLVVDLVASLLLSLIFLVQSITVIYLPLPLISLFISFVHMSLLNSMYCFEYFWSSRGCSLKERLNRLERHLFYFMGFGTTLTLASSFFDSFLLNGCVFGAIFPFFIISSYKANWKRETAGKNLPPVHIFRPSLLLTDRIISLFSNWSTSP